MTRIRDMENSDKTLNQLWRDGEQSYRIQRRKLLLQQEFDLQKEDSREPSSQSRFRSKSAFAVRKKSDLCDKESSSNDKRPYTSPTRAELLKRVAREKSKSAKSVRIRTEGPRCGSTIDRKSSAPGNRRKSSKSAHVNMKSEHLQGEHVGTETERPESPLSILSLSSGSSDSSNAAADDVLPQDTAREEPKSSRSRRSTTTVAVNSRVTSRLSRFTNSARRGRFRRQSRQFSLFPKEDSDKPNLLQLHKERVQSANYEQRINDLVENMTKYKMEDKDVARDYHFEINQNSAFQAKNKSVWRPGSFTAADMRRHVGDLTVRSLTCLSLDTCVSAE